MLVKGGPGSHWEFPVWTFSKNSSHSNRSHNYLSSFFRLATSSVSGSRGRECICVFRKTPRLSTSSTVILLSGGRVYARIAINPFKSSSRMAYIWGPHFFIVPADALAPDGAMSSFLANHRQLDYLSISLFMLISEEHKKSAPLAFCEGNPSVIGGLPSQSAINAEFASIFTRRQAII